eukprot:3474880-Amphidinium_carterae.1
MDANSATEATTLPRQTDLCCHMQINCAEHSARTSELQMMWQKLKGRLPRNGTLPVFCRKGQRAAVSSPLCHSEAETQAQRG